MPDVTLRSSRFGVVVGFASAGALDAVQAHAEVYMGLVEVGVGLIPGWGGCKEMLLRWWDNKRRPGGPMPVVSKVFETISMAAISTSAADARRHLFLRPEDGITMNRDRVPTALGRAWHLPSTHNLLKRLDRLGL